jgi:hypothetical protein
MLIPLILMKTLNVSWPRPLTLWLALMNTHLKSWK